MQLAVAKYWEQSELLVQVMSYKRHSTAFGANLELRIRTISRYHVYNGTVLAACWYLMNSATHYEAMQMTVAV